MNALYAAAAHGYLDILKTLYDAVAKVLDSQALTDFVNAGEDLKGWTLLHGALMLSDEDEALNMVQYLVEEVKVDVFKKDLENEDALDHARSKYCFQNVVSFLMGYDE